VPTSGSSNGRITDLYPGGLGILAEVFAFAALFATQVNLIPGHRLFKDDGRMAVLT
jgi:hypothetical protein